MNDTNIETGSVILNGLPGNAMTSQEQLEALRRIQAQAEQRVKLGVQLFKAAEAKLSEQNDVLEQMKKEQSGLREQINEDFTRSLHAYDQWVGQIDENFTHAIRNLEKRMDAMESEWAKSSATINMMVKRSEEMLSQSRKLLTTKLEKALASFTDRQASQTPVTKSSDITNGKKSSEEAKLTDETATVPPSPLSTSSQLPETEAESPTPVDAMQIDLSRPHETETRPDDNPNQHDTPSNTVPSPDRHPPATQIKVNPHALRLAGHQADQSTEKIFSTAIERLRQAKRNAGIGPDKNRQSKAG